MHLRTIMRRASLLAGALGLAVATACTKDDAVGSADAQAAPRSPADTILREMSARLASADEFTFEANRFIDTALLGGRDVPEQAEVEVAVKRPNKVRGVSRSRESTRDFYFDGRTVTVYDRTKNMYGTASIPGSIDEMVDRLDREFGFPPPLGEFIVADMYRTVLNDLQSRSLGQPRVVNGLTCATVNWSGELADGQLWVDRRTDLPCGFIAAFRRIEGKPEVRVTFSNWNLDATLPDTMFVFRPPPGARQIRMVTRAEIERQLRAEQQAAEQAAQQQPQQPQQPAQQPPAQQPPAQQPPAQQPPPQRQR